MSLAAAFAELTLYKALDKLGSTTTIAAYKLDMGFAKRFAGLDYEVDASFRDDSGDFAKSQKRSFRYTVGLRAGQDRVATLVSTKDLTDAYTSFSVLDVSYDDQELIDIQPAQDNSFFVTSTGRASRTLRVNGVLLNGEKFEWFKDWMNNYDQRFRSSKMIKKREVSVLTVDGVAYYGLIFNFTVSQNAQQENAPMFGFSFLVMSVNVLPEQHTGNTKASDLNYFTDFSTNFFGFDEKGKKNLDANHGDKEFNPETIGYPREESKPTDPRIVALGMAAVSMTDPAKWAALQGASKSQAAAQMTAKAASTIAFHSGDNSALTAAAASGMAHTVAMAIAKKENSAALGAKLAETGLQQAQNASSEMLAGALLFGVGEKFAPGRDYDNAKFDSWWRHLLSKVISNGFAASRMAISRGMKGGMSSVNFGKTVAYNSPTKEVGFTSKNAIAGADVVHTSMSMASALDMAAQVNADANSIRVSSVAQSNISDYKPGPMLDFTPSQDNETHTDPVALATVTVTPGASPAEGGDPTLWGPIDDI